jgi:hypothetical protein
MILIKTGSLETLVKIPNTKFQEYLPCWGCVVPCRQINLTVTFHYSFVIQWRTTDIFVSKCTFKRTTLWQRRLLWAVYSWFQPSEIWHLAHWYICTNIQISSPPLVSGQSKKHKLKCNNNMTSAVLLFQILGFSHMYIVSFWNTLQSPSSEWLDITRKSDCTSFLSTFLLSYTTHTLSVRFIHQASCP